MKNGVNGLIVEPTPESICQAVDWLYMNPEAASEMGARGAAQLAGMSWESTAQKIIDACGEDKPSMLSAATCFGAGYAADTSAVGGGRLRLQGLYHNLGEDVAARYVGSYDWPGEIYREYRHSKTLLEIDKSAAFIGAPLSCSN